MSVQVFLQGKLAGIDSFVSGEGPLAGRAHWVALLSEILPRALLAELGLAKILLGSSGGGAFLVVLPQELIPQAVGFLESAAAGVSAISGGRLRLVWGSTENLGDWSIVRKRLAEAMWGPTHTQPVAAALFEPGAVDPTTPEDAAYFESLAAGVRRAESAYWSPDDPARISLSEGKHGWRIGNGLDEVPIARHAAMDDDNPEQMATLGQLASRASGRHQWGVLRGDIDSFGIRLRRAQTVEEHVQLSMSLKQFFAGELEVACLMGDYWRRVSILYTGGDDFAVAGSWDALLLLAREIQRIFQRFADANLKELPGPEGKTITMALATANGRESTLSSAYREAGRRLAAAKSSGKDCFHVFGRAVEWRHVNHASDLKEMMLRMIRELDCRPEFLLELSGFYREKPDTRADRPWRYFRRLGLVLGAHKDREVQRLQKALITDIVGKSATQVKLRPAGLVAVEWARMLARV